MKIKMLCYLPRKTLKRKNVYRTKKNIEDIKEKKEPTPPLFAEKQVVFQNKKDHILKKRKGIKFNGILVD